MTSSDRNFGKNKNPIIFFLQIYILLAYFIHERDSINNFHSSQNNSKCLFMFNYKLNDCYAKFYVDVIALERSLNENISVWTRFFSHVSSSFVQSWVITIYLKISCKSVKKTNKKSSVNIITWKSPEKSRRFSLKNFVSFFVQ